MPSSSPHPSDSWVPCLRSALQCWASSPTTSLASDPSSPSSSSPSPWRPPPWPPARRRSNFFQINIFTFLYYFYVILLKFFLQIDICFRSFSSMPSTGWSSQSFCLRTRHSSWGDCFSSFSFILCLGDITTLKTKKKDNHQRQRKGFKPRK